MRGPEDRIFAGANTADSHQGRFPISTYPLLDSLDERCFWEGMACGEFFVQRSSAYVRPRSPPVPLCPECSNSHLEAFAASGRGSIYAWMLSLQELAVWSERKESSGENRQGRTDLDARSGLYAAA